MTLFEGMQNRWILFIRDFEILAPSCVGTKLLRKLQGIEHNRVWMKKKIGAAKPIQGERKRYWQQQGRKS